MLAKLRTTQAKFESAVPWTLRGNAESSATCESAALRSPRIAWVTITEIYLLSRQIFPWLSFR